MSYSVTVTTVLCGQVVPSDCKCSCQLLLLLFVWVLQLTACCSTGALTLGMLVSRLIQTTWTIKQLGCAREADRCLSSCSMHLLQETTQSLNLCTTC
jgi:hypothetical protein